MHESCRALTFLLGCALAAQENQLTPAEKSAGWKLLFNGKDMSGWDDPRQKTPAGDAWTLEDGCLKAKSKARITEDLFTQETFSDFELAFDWRISKGGNSGLKYRIQDHAFLREGGVRRFEDQVNLSLTNRRTDRPAKGQDYVIGFEYQILDNALNSDARAGLTHTAGALYDMVPPQRDATLPGWPIQSLPNSTARHARGAVAQQRKGGGCGSGVPGCEGPYCEALGRVLPGLQPLGR